MNKAIEYFDKACTIKDFSPEAYYNSPYQAGWKELGYYYKDKKQVIVKPKRSVLQWTPSKGRVYVDLDKDIS